MAAPVCASSSPMPSWLRICGNPKNKQNSVTKRTQRLTFFIKVYTGHTTYPSNCWNIHWLLRAFSNIPLGTENFHSFFKCLCKFKQKKNKSHLLDELLNHIYAFESHSNFRSKRWSPLHWSDYYRPNPNILSLKLTDSNMGVVSFSVATVCLIRAKCKQVSPSSSWTLMLAFDLTRSSIRAEWPWDTASSRGVCCRLLRMSTSARFCPTNLHHLTDSLELN